MNEYIYAFGSICRGELDSSSDIDILVVNDIGYSKNQKSNYSYYRKDTIKNLWNEGNPFAWHLHKESKIIYSQLGDNFLQDLGTPNKYNRLIQDLNNLKEIFEDAKDSVLQNMKSVEFDLSTIFLVIRNVATCFELGVNQKFCFSRDSALQISTNKLEIEANAYQTLRKCRILSTRGIGESLTSKQLEEAIVSIPEIENWIKNILINSKQYESV